MPQHLNYCIDYTVTVPAQMKKEEKEIVRIEQDWAWMYAYLYLENLKHLREVKEKSEAAQS